LFPMPALSPERSASKEVHLACLGPDESSLQAQTRASSLFGPALPMIRSSRSLRNACRLLCIVLIVLFLERRIGAQSSPWSRPPLVGVRRSRKLDRLFPMPALPKEVHRKQYLHFLNFSQGIASLAVKVGSLVPYARSPERSASKAVHLACLGPDESSLQAQTRASSLFGPALPMIRNSRSLRNACSLLCIVLIVLFLERRIGAQSSPWSRPPLVGVRRSRKLESLVPYARSPERSASKAVHLACLGPEFSWIA
jgi:hypothetical protein